MSTGIGLGTGRGMAGCKFAKMATHFWRAGALALAVAAPAGAQTAADTCTDIAGKPQAEAPISRAAFDGYFSTLARARPYCEAAALGATPNPAALFHLAVMMQREGVHAHAIEVFEMAAAGGVAAAHTKLADYYNFGIGGTPENISRAIEEYTKAAEAGDIAAKSSMAIMYRLGRGVPRDSRKMLALLQETADAGYHVSQLRLAELYLSPRALPPALARQLALPNPVEAVRYYQMAADQGSTEAQAKIAQIYEGAGEFADPTIKLRLLEHAAKGGDGQALNTLGFMHERGDGLAYNPQKAAQYYIAAIETGGLDVTKLRGRVNGYTPYWDRQTALEFQRILQERGLYMGALDAQVGFGTLAAARKLGQQ